MKEMDVINRLCMLSMIIIDFSWSVNCSCENLMGIVDLVDWLSVFMYFLMIIIDYIDRLSERLTYLIG